MKARGRLLCVAVMAAACTGITDNPRERPFVYLLLAATPVTSRATAPDSAPWAAVLTTRTPVDARYRDVEAFRLRRVRDGAVFIWRRRDVDEAAIGRIGFFVDGGSNANVTLTAAGDSGGLGWRALTEDDRYDLEIRSGGLTISGSAAIPPRPRLQLVERGTAHIVYWPRTPAAAAFYVDADNDRRIGTFTTDTAFVWCEVPVLGGSRRLRVVALDENALRYLRDSTTAQAGLDGALGLFGGASEARLTLTGPPVNADAGCALTHP